MVDAFEAIAVADRLRLMERVARYSWAIDSGDMDAYLDCFMEDGWIEHPLPDGRPHRFEGHQGIRRWLEENFRGRPSQTYGHQHQLSALVMAAEGREVRLKAYCTILRHEFHRQYWPRGPSWRMGTWHALLGQRNGDWRIRQLEVRMWTDTALGAGRAIADRPSGSPGARG